MFTPFVVPTIEKTVVFMGQFTCPVRVFPYSWVNEIVELISPSELKGLF